MSFRLLSSLTLVALVACQRDPSEERRIAPLNVTPVSAVADSNVWHATYWRGAWESIALQRDERAIDFDWGAGVPAASMDGDAFTALWEGDFDFATSGEYVFTSYSDDGICVYVDGKTVNCLWDDHGPTEVVTTAWLAAGRHHVKVDYYDSGGGAVAKVRWRPEGGNEPDAPGATLDGYVVRWAESFEGGKGDLSRAWGPRVDESVRGELSMHSTSDDQDSGAMVPPTSRDAGFGYGLYSFTLTSNGKIGGYALIWPSSDVWPGPELDVFEITEDGVPYGTVHWKGNNGENAYASVMYWGIDPRERHTYSILWEPGAITYFVDGVKQGDTIYDHVPTDAAHGGENESPGIGMQTWWNSGAQGSTITCYEVTYATK